MTHLQPTFFLIWNFLAGGMLDLGRVMGILIQKHHV